MKTFLTSVSAMLLATCSFGQTTQTIRGVVRDQVLQQPIPGATIILENFTPLKGTTTNDNGWFTLADVSVGRQTIKVSSIGFVDRIVPNIQVGSGKEVVIDVYLEESIIQMSELIITSHQSSLSSVNEMSLASGRSFTAEETKRFPASLGDPLRLAASFAGTANLDDESNEIIIRGNTPRGILWKLEGIEIPSPNHFSSEGAASGGVSMFSTQVIARSDFLTSAFAPEYGNATAGVFDIHLRNGNNEKHERTLQAGFLGLDVSAEGPLSKESNSSYLFNYRYSTLALLTQLGIKVQDEGEDNVFQDLSFKLNFPTRKAGTFSLFGLGGLSSAVQNINNENDQEDYNMGVAGLTHSIAVSEKTLLKTTLSVTDTKNIDNLLRPSIGYSNTKTFTKSFVRSFVQVYHKINVQNTLEGGLTWSALGYNFKGHIVDPTNAPPLQDFDTFDEKGSSSTYQAYLSWKLRPRENLTLVSGMHVFGFNLTAETSLEPRMSALWQRTPRQGITFGYGLHSRIESLEYYFGNLIASDGSTYNYNRDLKMTKAHHLVAGLTQVLNQFTKLKAEIYFQKLFNVPVATDPLAGAYSSLNFTSGYTQIDLNNSGTGNNYGSELTLERSFANTFYYLISTSLYNSKYSGGDQIVRNTRFNGNFAFNFLGGKEFIVGIAKQNTIGISGKFGWAGNKRFVPIDVVASQQAGREVRDVSMAFTERYPDHFRADIQINFRRNARRFTSEWRLDIQNVTNRKNVLTDYYSNGSVYYERGIGLVPVLSYRIEF